MTGRLVAQKLSEAWRQQVVIDNRAGANGQIGCEIVAKAPADGYTWLMATSSTHGSNVGAAEKITYDPVKDFDAVTQLVLIPSVLTVHPSVPVKTVAELIRLAKAKPGQLSFGSGGTAGVPIFNAGMRGAKGTPWIGGTRAMSLWRWPGRIHPGTCDRLVAHIDVFPTFAELAGVDLAADGSLHDQVAGRSLVPLLTDPAAPEGLAWDERPLFTHVGRWPKRSDPDLAKYQAAAVRTKAWALVSPEGGPEPDWQLYDLRTDYGQQHDVRAAHPDVASRLAAAFDNWWADVLTRLINEQAVGPQINPFQELYYRQFGGQPTPEALERMRPEREVLSPQRRSPQPKTTPAG